MRKIYLHLGIHKTATKFLQEAVFPEIKDISYLPKAKYERDLLDSLLHQDVLTFNYHKDAIRDEFLKRAGNDDLPLLISNELLFGNIFFHNNNRYSLLVKLKSLFPEAKILLSIRGQKQMIDSIYREYLVQGGCCKIEQFLNAATPSGKSILSYNPGLDPEALKYGKYLDGLAEMFGAENCLFLPYEMLIKDTPEYLGQILGFLNSKSSPDDFSAQKRHGSMSNNALKFLRVINKMHSSAMHGSGWFPNSWNVGRLMRKMGIGKLSREKTAPFQFKLPIDYQEDNDYIDQKYDLKLKKDYEKYYYG